MLAPQSQRCNSACPADSSVLRDDLQRVQPPKKLTMSLSMYQASVPNFIRQLSALSAILDKALDHVNSQGLDPSVLTTSRLAADMLPFTNQIYIATDTAKGCAARLAGERRATDTGRASPDV